LSGHSTGRSIGQVTPVGQFTKAVRQEPSGQREGFSAGQPEVTVHSLASFTHRPSVHNTGALTKQVFCVGQVPEDEQVPSGQVVSEPHVCTLLHLEAELTQVLSEHCTEAASGHTGNVAHCSWLSAQAPLEHRNKPSRQSATGAQADKRGEHAPFSHLISPRAQVDRTGHKDWSTTQLESGQRNDFSLGQG
jgi:hypothetical protein